MRQIQELATVGTRSAIPLVTTRYRFKVTVLLVNNFVGAKVDCLKVALLCLFCIKWT